MPTPPTWHSREDFPHLLNSLGLNGVGVEVGVQTGHNATHIRQNWNGRLLLGVDPWKPYGTDVTEAMHEDYAQLAMKRLRATGKDFALLRMASLDAASWFTNLRFPGSVDTLNPLLDWVYLDGSHDYQDVLNDIDAWYPLIRSGGILAGHDWVVDGWHRHGQPYEAVPAQLGAETGPGPFYVRRAVLERFKHEQLSITDPETDMGWQSFLTVKP